MFSSDCTTISVVVRYYCINSPFNPSEHFDFVYDEVIPQGLIKYFERELNYGNAVKNLKIIPRRTFFQSKKFLVSGGCGRSGNIFLNTPVLFYFCDERFGLFYCNPPISWKEYQLVAAAHELGHDILSIKSGYMWSWTHKSTSTLSQETTSSTPLYPYISGRFKLITDKHVITRVVGLSPGDVDVMYYYNKRSDQTACNARRVWVQG